jgi:hypothetical protein
VKLVGIYITYMDGSSSSLTEPQVGYAVY